MTYFEKTDSGIRLRVRLAPKAKREGIESVYTDARNDTFLKIAVKAAPVDGKANKALIALLAEKFHTAKNRFEIVSGLTERTKTLFITGNQDAEAILKEIETCLKSSAET